MTIEYTKRKPNRYKDFDYSQDGAYFVTICAKDRKEIFASIEIGEVSCSLRLTRVGEIIENEILLLSQVYDEVCVDCSVIMPNHVHMLIGIYGDWRYDVNGRLQAAPTVSRMIGQWKRAISIKVGYSVWQKSFHDHIIRNNYDYQQIAEYIEYNPERWTEDCLYNGETIKTDGKKPPVSLF
ncbi:MAG: hypothetical protein FWF87_01600 [Synergistaceae bacterium]|nr:hypothetical protein [Synergistaceae bacterium]